MHLKLFLTTIIIAFSCWRDIYGVSLNTVKLPNKVETVSINATQKSIKNKIPKNVKIVDKATTSTTKTLNKQPKKPFPQDKSINVAVFSLANNFNLTLIYGKDHNKMNHSAAELFCKKLGKNVNTSGQEYVISHLMSVHNLIISKKLMDFVLKHERNQFWIGGMVTKVMNRNTGALGYTMSWSDHTPDNYRRIHRPDLHLENMGIDESQCVSVDYLSGRWGVHKCEKEMNFVCATFLVDPVEQRKQVNKLEPDDEAMRGDVTVPPLGGGPVRNDGERFPPRNQEDDEQ